MQFYRVFYSSQWHVTIVRIIEKQAFCILRDRCAFNDEQLNATLENNYVEAIEHDYFDYFSK